MANLGQNSLGSRCFGFECSGFGLRMSCARDFGQFRFRSISISATWPKSSILGSQVKRHQGFKPYLSSMGALASPRLLQRIKPRPCWRPESQTTQPFCCPIPHPQARPQKCSSNRCHSLCHVFFTIFLLAFSCHLPSVFSLKISFRLFSWFCQSSNALFSSICFLFKPPNQ